MHSPICNFMLRRHLNGYPDRPPVRPNISLGDSLAGLHAAFGTVMALLHAQKGSSRGAGQAGQVVDASISESIFNMLEGCVPEYAMHGHDRPPSGSTISGVCCLSSETLRLPQDLPDCLYLGGYMRSRLLQTLQRHP